MTQTDSLPPYCPEAERGVLGCCLLDIGKTNVALKAGVNSRWFYEARHAELFQLLKSMALNGGGDVLIATIGLRERGQLQSLGGLDYLIELQNSVPSAENIGYYLPELRDYFQRRLILDVSGQSDLDPARLKQSGGRPAQYGPDTLLECLGEERLNSSDWKRLCSQEQGVSHGKFFELLKVLVADKKVQKSVIDGKWESIQLKSRNSYHDNTQY